MDHVNAAAQRAARRLPQLNAALARSLDAWISARAGSSKETDNNDRVIATLKVPPDFDRDKEGELQQALDELKAQFGIAVQRPRDLDVDAFAGSDIITGQSRVG